MCNQTHIWPIFRVVLFCTYKGTDFHPFGGENRSLRAYFRPSFLYGIERSEIVSNPHKYWVFTLTCEGY